MCDDLALQKDELEALQSIYNQDEFKVNENTEQVGGQFFAHLDLPRGFKVVYKLLSNKNRDKKDGAASSTTQPETFEVEFLPPIVLYVTLPPNYPSQEKPNFLLSCKWLTRGKLSILCRHLDQLWEESPGMEILFRWTQFLKEECVNVLNIKHTLDVSSIYTKQMLYMERKRVKPMSEASPLPQLPQESPMVETASVDVDKVVSNVENMSVYDSTVSDNVNSEITGYISQPRPKQRKNFRKNKSKQQLRQDPNDIATHSGKNNKFICDKVEHKQRMVPDERTVFDLPLTDTICLVLQQFNLDQRGVMFARTHQECNVCFCSKVGSECIQFNECAHVFCKQCISGYFVVQVRDGNVKLLKCLADKCDTEATPDQVKQVLSPETFAKYDAALLAATLDTMSDIVYCPRRTCQYPVTLEPEESMGCCPSCQYVFCIYCKMVYHGVEPCRLKSEEQQKLVNDYQTGSAENRLLLEKRYGRRQLQRLVDTALSEQWVSANSQNCPRCNVSIEKSSGCNKMACWRCNTYFCWLCQATLSHATPYLHFNNPASRCFNRLFEGVDPNEDEDEDDDDFWLDFDDL